jgi:hypothetical protein
MNRRDRCSFRPSLDVLPSRITPSSLALGPVLAMDLPVSPVAGIYVIRIEPTGISFPPVSISPILGPSLPREPGLVDPQELDPLAPTLP